MRSKEYRVWRRTTLEPVSWVHDVLTIPLAGVAGLLIGGMFALLPTMPAGSASIPFVILLYLLVLFLGTGLIAMTILSEKREQYLLRKLHEITR